MARKKGNQQKKGVSNTGSGSPVCLGKGVLIVLLLILILWLDCTLRGIDSFLRMGTTTFFSVLWCSVLCIIIFQVFKFLLALNTVHERRSNTEQAAEGPGQPDGQIPTSATNRGPGIPSTSGSDHETTSEDEVIRLLNCSDNYAALGLSRFEDIDVTVLTRGYKKKAKLVHPDKNMGNEKADEAFKKLQNAYEVLLDSSKRKAYDDELKREELKENPQRPAFRPSGPAAPQWANRDHQTAAPQNPQYSAPQYGNYPHQAPRSHFAPPQANYNYGQPDYGQQGPARYYGQGYGGHGIPPQSTGGYGRQPYGMPQQGPHGQAYGQHQPGEMPYAAGPPPNQAYGSSAPQQSYGYTQQSYPPYGAGPGYPQPSAYPTPVGGYASYPSQPGYGQQAVAASTGYWSAQQRQLTGQPVPGYGQPAGQQPSVPSQGMIRPMPSWCLSTV